MDLIKSTKQWTSKIAEGIQNLPVGREPLDEFRGWLKCAWLLGLSNVILSAFITVTLGILFLVDGFNQDFLEIIVTFAAYAVGLCYFLRLMRQLEEKSPVTPGNVSHTLFILVLISLIFTVVDLVVTLSIYHGNLAKLNRSPFLGAILMAGYLWAWKNYIKKSKRVSAYYGVKD